MSTDDEQLLHQGLHALAQALRNGSLTPTRLAEWCIERHERLGGDLEAYRTWDAARFRQSADLAERALGLGYDLGPLQGLPFSAKDLYGVPGYPTYAGSPKRLPSEWERPGPVVSALLAQLSVPAGKTHTVEFAYGGLGTNPHWGTPRNPWDPEQHRVPGGSSAGAGVSLIEGSAFFAFGTDTAGSVRIPASMTGNVGLKPTYGVWPLEGIVPLSPRVDSPGVLARSVADVAYVFLAIDQTLRGRPASLAKREVAGLRIGKPAGFFWDDCSAGVVERVEEALRELEAEGARVVTIEMPEIEEAYSYFRDGALAPPEIYEFLRRCLPEWIDTLDPDVARRIKGGEEVPAWEWLRRRQRFRELGATLAERLAAVDVVATPTVAVSPPLVEELREPGVYPKTNLLALRNTSTVNLLDLCAITLPVGLDDVKMPVGLQLIGKGYQESQLLGVAQAVERVLGSARERLGPAPIS